MPPSEPNFQNKESSTPSSFITKNKEINFKKDSSGTDASKKDLVENDDAGFAGDLGNASDYEKFSAYESGVNDLQKITQNDKIYKKNDIDKLCSKGNNDLNLTHHEKIENEIEKPLLKKVQNVEEVITEKVSNNEDENFTPRTPSMAERRKLFETGRNNHLEEKEMLDGVIVNSKSSECLKDEGNSFERGSGQRNSIAGRVVNLTRGCFKIFTTNFGLKIIERRRIYENRTVSTQDQPVADRIPQSPLHRRNSLKAKNEEPKEEQQQQVNRRMTVGGPIKSSEIISDKKNSGISTPTPKRTSTVFGIINNDNK